MHTASPAPRSSDDLSGKCRADEVTWKTREDFIVLTSPQVESFKSLEKPGDSHSNVATGGGLPPPTLQEWIDNLDRFNPREARLAAARAIGKMGKEAEEAVPKLTELLSDRSQKVRVAAVEALGKMGKESASSVREIFNGMGWQVQSTDDEYLKQASVALGKIGKEAPTKVLNVVKERLKFIPWFQRWLAVKTCGLLGKKAADLAPQLRIATYDDDHNVKEAANHALHLIDKAMS